MYVLQWFGNRQDPVPSGKIGNEPLDDGWEWLNPRNDTWQRVPDDIIHWGEPTPDGQAVAFEYPIGSGQLRCFFPPTEKEDDPHKSTISPTDK
jgi:hypothetical protein